MDEREAEERGDLDQMRRDPQAHMTAAVARHVVSRSEGAESAERSSDAPASIVLRHLRRCLLCRNMLLDALELSGVDKTHSGYGLVARAEKWARWAAAGVHATEGVQRFLREQGANIIYERDGILYEELPDGTVRPYMGSFESEMGNENRSC